MSSDVHVVIWHSLSKQLKGRCFGWEKTEDRIHPPKLTWNPNTTPLEKENHLQTSTIFAFHVSFRGCTIQGWYGMKRLFPRFESVRLCLSICLSSSKLFSSHVKNLGGSQVCPAGPPHFDSNSCFRWILPKAWKAHSRNDEKNKLKSFQKKQLANVFDMPINVSNKKVTGAGVGSVGIRSLYRHKTNVQQNLMKSHVKLVVRTIAKKESRMAPF